MATEARRDSAADRDKGLAGSALRSAARPAVASRPERPLGEGAAVRTSAGEPEGERAPGAAEATAAAASAYQRRAEACRLLAIVYEALGRLEGERDALERLLGKLERFMAAWLEELGERRALLRRVRDFEAQAVPRCVNAALGELRDMEDALRRVEAQLKQGVETGSQLADKLVEEVHSLHDAVLKHVATGGAVASPAASDTGTQTKSLA